MKASSTTILIGYLAFGTFGIYEGLLGVVWPAMSETFGVSLDTLGVLLIAGLFGFVLVSFTSGSLIRWRSIHWVLLAGTTIRTIGYLGMAFSPVWEGVIASVLLLTMGGGAIDTSLNGFVSTQGNSRQMNWLHASFGVGATVGPFLAAAIIGLGGDWRVSFAVVAAMQGLAALLVALTAPSWKVKLVETKEEVKPEASLASTIRLRAVWLGILFFFLYTGTELSAGQWSFALFALGRGVPEVIASYWVGIFWGTFTIGRILFGFVADKWQPKLMLRISLVGVVLGAGLFWWSPLAAWVGFAGLALMGLALAPLFPTLIAGTLGRVGITHVANTIGFQIAAAGLGGSIITSAVGVLAESQGLEWIGGSVFVLSVVMLAVYELLEYLAIRETIKRPA
jgi:fucose permease